MWWTVLAGLVGGIGLFLLGMRLMTDGLRLAAGAALRELLARSTRTPLRGLLSGVVITGLVQSSSAVTVATIGFVNAGLMDLRRAATVIYGSNVGTTMTGWLVALVGLNVDVKAFALPAVGIGMFLRIGGSGRRAALGEALAGFGVFFLGIELLQTGFSGLGDGMDLAALGGGPLDLLLFTGIGFLLTLFMQSSSAALAVVLTAASGGVIPVGLAAAMVIGANIGTTSTAALAVIGATANAKRLAGAHVVFNALTGVVALVGLPLLLYGLVALQRLMHQSAEPAVVLALFHSVFNVLGVLLMLPFNDRLIRFLERRFRSAEEDEARPRFLDRNVANTPALALPALRMELDRVVAIAKRMLAEAINRERPDVARVQSDQRILGRLVDSVGEFVVQVQRNPLPEQADSALPDGLRVARYASEMAELALAMAAARAGLPVLSDADLRAEANHFQAGVATLLEAVLPLTERDQLALYGQRLDELQNEYQQLKSHFLRAATISGLGARAMVDWLDWLSNVRRSAEQAYKSALYMSAGMAEAPSA